MLLVIIVPVYLAKKCSLFYIGSGKAEQEGWQRHLPHQLLLSLNRIALHTSTECCGDIFGSLNLDCLLHLCGRDQDENSGARTCKA